MMMKIKYLSLASVASLGLFAASCSNNDFTDTAKGQGKIQLALTVDNTVTSRSFADDGTVTVDDLKIRLTSTDPNNPYSGQWNSVSEFESKLLFPVGTYTLEAFFGEDDQEGFNNPYIYGSQDISVELDKTTSVSLKASLQNSQFVITYSDEMKNYLTDYKVELLSKGSATSIVYAKDETRPAYVKAGEVAIYLNLTKPDGTSAAPQIATVNAEPAHRYTVNLTMSNNEYDEALINITFDDALELEDYVINLADDLATPSAPIVTATNPIDNTATSENQVASFITGDELTDPLAFNIIARAGLKSVKLKTTNSQYINSNGLTWPTEEIELIDLDNNTQNILTNLGLLARGVWNDPDQLAYLDFSGVARNVHLTSGVETADITFTVTVEDTKGQTVDTSINPIPTLTLRPSKPTLTLEPISSIPLDEIEATVRVTYNSNNLGNLTFSYGNGQGTITKMEATSMEVISEGVYEYTFDKTVNSNPFEVTVKDNYNDIEESVKFTLTDAMLEVREHNIWAKKAYIYLNPNYYSNGLSEIYYSSNGVDFSKVSVTGVGENLYLLTGLTPGKQCYIKADHPTKTGKVLNKVAFTTEEALQVENGNMETWCEPDGGKYWTLYVPGASEKTTIWETLNRLTTSSLNASDLDTYGYIALSGTIPTTDCAEGSKAACLRTAGWGAGSTSFGSGSIVKNITQGELYLGSYDSTNQTGNYGIAFNVRPSSMTFKAKYSPYRSGDQGYAEITILDESGNTLASNTKWIDSSANYQSITLDLNYTINAQKAAKIKIIFRSTDPNGNYLTKKDLNLSAFKLDGTQHTGSELYIDDITLNY